MTSTNTGLARLAIAAGVGIIATATNAVIAQTGGYLTSHALLVVGLAGGVIVGAYVLPSAWASARTIACLMIAALCAGELYNGAQTLERIVIVREQAQSSLRDLKIKHDGAVAELAALKAGTIASPRLDMARTALAALEAGVGGPRAVMAEADVAKAKAELARIPTKAWSRWQVAQRRFVKAEAELKRARDQDLADRATLITTAKAEVAAALADAEARHGDRVAEAEAAVAAHPLPPSATPLADKTGLPAWAIDMAFALLLSLGANGLAGSLIAFGAHHKTDRSIVTTAEQSDFPALDVERFVAARAALIGPQPNGSANIVAFPKPDGSPNGSGPRGPKPGSRKRTVKETALADLRGRLNRGERFGSQDELAGRYGVAKSTMSDWLREWERAGLIPMRRTEGRRKAVAAA